MSGSDSNFTNATNQEWNRKVLNTFEALEIILLSSVLWTFVSMIAYGTKTGRWRKSAQTSSLNNGLIFIAATMTLFTYIPRLSATLAKYILLDHDLDGDSCELLYDFGTGAFIVAACLSYVFLWARQRMIYNHPYVKPHVSKWMNWVSRLSIILLIMDALGMGFTQIKPRSYHVGTQGCVFEKQDDDDNDLMKIALLLFFLFAQFVIAVLFVYPAKKVLLQQRRNGNHENGATWLAMLICCGNSNLSTSPIQMSVRRTMLCSFLMVVSEVVVVIVDISIPRPRPPPVMETVYDVALVFHSICIVTTFGFSSSVFTLFWPKCQIRVKSTEPFIMAQGSNPEDIKDEEFETKHV